HGERARRHRGRAGDPAQGQGPAVAARRLWRPDGAGRRVGARAAGLAREEAARGAAALRRVQATEARAIGGGPRARRVPRMTAPARGADGARARATPAFVYVPDLAAVDAELELSAAESHYVARVCRARVGDALDASDGRGGLAELAV